MSAFFPFVFVALSFTAVNHPVKKFIKYFLVRGQIFVNWNQWKWNQTFTRFCFFPFVVFWSDLRKVLIGDPVIDCVFLTELLLRLIFVHTFKNRDYATRVKDKPLLNPGTECLESVFLSSHSETEPAGLWVEVLTPANDFCDFLNGGKWSTERILSFARSIGISDVFARALVLSC